MNYDPHFVTMIDTFMSGWGHAADLDNKLIIECDNRDEAETVAENARNRGDQKRVTIHSTTPPDYFPKRETDEQGAYQSGRFYVQIKTRDDMPRWFEEGAFTK